MNSMNIALNILRRISKEKTPFLAQVLAPVLIGLVMFSVLVSGSAQKKMPVGLINEDSGKYGSYLAEQLAKDNGYDMQSYKKEDVEKAIGDKSISAAVLIPQNFSADVENGAVPVVSIYKSENSGIIQGLNRTVSDYVFDIYVSAMIGRTSDRYEESRLSSEAKVIGELNKNTISISQETLKDKKNITKEATIFGFFILFILQFAVLGVGLILEDKKEKTFMRTYCAPVKNHEVVLGNLIANILLGTFMIVLFMGLARLIYNINAGFGVFIVLLACLVTSIGYAIGISAFIRDNEKFFVVSGPISGIMCVIGGCFMPFDMLPESMQRISGMLPTRWVMDAITKLLSGSSLYDVTVNILILVLFALVFLIFGINTLKPNVEDL